MLPIRAKKSLGQNFLVDEKARIRIAKAADIQENDVVVEIGPGTGLLTHELLTFPLKKLIGFEVDPRAVALLAEEIQDERFEIRADDFLEADIPKLYKEYGKLEVVGNIPYYITSPIIFKLIDEREYISDALLLVQHEVAERLTAKPRTKEYGIPTVLANFFGEVKFLFKVKAGSFKPVPNVDSALVKIDFERSYFARSDISPPKDFEAKTFQKFVRTMFGMRRKMLRNNLKNFLNASELPGATDSPEMSAFLSRRAEELDVREFLAFFELAQSLRHK